MKRLSEIAAGVQAVLGAVCSPTTAARSCATLSLRTNDPRTPTAEVELRGTGEGGAP